MRYSIFKEQTRDLREFGRFWAEPRTYRGQPLPVKENVLLRAGGRCPPDAGLAVRGRREVEGATVPTAASNNYIQELRFVNPSRR